MLETDEKPTRYNLDQERQTLLPDSQNAFISALKKTGWRSSVINKAVDHVLLGLTNQTHKLPDLEMVEANDESLPHYYLKNSELFRKLYFYPLKIFGNESLKKQELKAVLTASVTVAIISEILFFVSNYLPGILHINSELFITFLEEMSGSVFLSTLLFTSLLIEKFVLLKLDKFNKSMLKGSVLNEVKRHANNKFTLKNIQDEVDAYFNLIDKKTPSNLSIFDYNNPVKKLRLQAIFIVIISMILSYNYTFDSEIQDGLHDKMESFIVESIRTIESITTLNTNETERLSETVASFFEVDQKNLDNLSFTDFGTVPFNSNHAYNIEFPLANSATNFEGRLLSVPNEIETVNKTNDYRRYESEFVSGMLLTVPDNGEVFAYELESNNSDIQVVFDTSNGAFIAHGANVTSNTKLVWYVRPERTNLAELLAYPSDVSPITTDLARTILDVFIDHFGYLPTRNEVKSHMNGKSYSIRPDLNPAHSRQFYIDIERIPQNLADTLNQSASSCYPSALVLMLYDVAEAQVAGANPNIVWYRSGIYSGVSGDSSEQDLKNNPHAWNIDGTDATPQTFVDGDTFTEAMLQKAGIKMTEITLALKQRVQNVQSFMYENHQNWQDFIESINQNKKLLGVVVLLIIALGAIKRDKNKKNAKKNQELANTFEDKESIIEATDSVIKVLSRLRFELSHEFDTDAPWPLHYQYQEEDEPLSEIDLQEMDASALFFLLAKLPEVWTEKSYEKHTFDREENTLYEGLKQKLIELLASGDQYAPDNAVATENLSLT